MRLSRQCHHILPFPCHGSQLTSNPSLPESCVQLIRFVKTLLGSGSEHRTLKMTGKKNDKFLISGHLSSFPSLCAHPHRTIWLSEFSLGSSEASSDVGMPFPLGCLQGCVSLFIREIHLSTVLQKVVHDFEIPLRSRDSEWCGTILANDDGREQEAAGDEHQKRGKRGSS